MDDRDVKIVADDAQQRCEAVLQQAAAVSAISRFASRDDPNTED